MPCRLPIELAVRSADQPGTEGRGGAAAVATAPRDLRGVDDESRDLLCPPLAAPSTARRPPCPTQDPRAAALHRIQHTDGRPRRAPPSRGRAMLLRGEGMRRRREGRGLAQPGLVLAAVRGGALRRRRGGRGKRRATAAEEAELLGRPHLQTCAGETCAPGCALIGKEMAYVQMKSIVASVLEEFVVDVVIGEDAGGGGVPEHVLSVTLRMKGGLPVQVRRGEGWRLELKVPSDQGIGFILSWLCFFSLTITIL
ncbi:hypothetical protein EJB05_29659, partial [Eragrostis curvula]